MPVTSVYVFMRIVFTPRKHTSTPNFVFSGTLVEARSRCTELNKNAQKAVYHFVRVPFIIGEGQ